MKDIAVEESLRNACPHFKGVAVYASFTNSTFSPELWSEIEQSLTAFRRQFTTETLKQVSSIQATRQIYKALGKDPSRYRPSGEALVRRTIQGKELYRINTAVDLINLASIEFGYSIGGFDMNKIQGDTIRLGVGQKGEPYEGIGRGALNIEGLPVYRDSAGGFGTPTSDHERTKIDLSTTHLLAFVNGYDGNETNTRLCAERIVDLLQKYCSCTSYSITTF